MRWYAGAALGAKRGTQNETQSTNMQPNKRARTQANARNQGTQRAIMSRKLPSLTCTPTEPLYNGFD